MPVGADEPLRVPVAAAVAADGPLRVPVGPMGLCTCLGTLSCFSHLLIPAGRPISTVGRTIFKTEMLDFIKRKKRSQAAVCVHPALLPVCRCRVASGFKLLGLHRDGRFPQTVSQNQPFLS